jgi:ABC-2 type transport system ATP-binding protein
VSSVISAKNLVKIYGRRRNKIAALQGVDLEVEAGETFGLLGPNGAGKTTFVKCMLGLLHPTSGEVTIFDKRPTDPESRRKLGFAPEIANFPDYLSGLEVMTLHGLLIGMTEKEAEAKGQELLEEAELSRAPRRVKGYSKGMLRRLAVAQSLLGNPELVVLDEPTADLDPLGRRQIRDKLLQLKEAGVTIILNSHLLSEVERVCDRIAIVHEGHVIASGTMGELVPEGTDLETVFIDLVQAAKREQIA